MPISIQLYRKEHERGVQEFNERLQAGGAEPDFVFFKESVPRWLPQTGDEELFNEFFVALDGGVVRGGYALKHQRFQLPDGSFRSLAYYHHPLSEGIVRKSLAAVGGLLLRDAMQRQPLLYCLGMGGYDRPLPRMLVGIGWSHCLVPFFFKVVKPFRFFREMEALRRSAWRRRMMDLAACTGIGFAAMKLHQAWAGAKLRFAPDTTVTEVEVFSDWATPLWEKARRNYSLAAVRDAATLQRLYPASEKHLTRLRISRRGDDLGWAVVAQRRPDTKYGSMRVGSILDCWADPTDAVPVMRAATDCLVQQGVDLIVSNQSHPLWGDALRTNGFMEAASNFIFAASKPLAALLPPLHNSSSRIHFTRADGDGLPRNF